MTALTKTMFGKTVPLIEQDDPSVIAIYWEAFEVETGNATWGWVEPGHQDDLRYGSSLNLEQWEFYPVTEMTDADVKEAGFDPR